MNKMADSNSSNGSECAVFDTYPYVIVAAVSAGSAMVSALCCIFVICLIFLLKKHYFFIQRMILYHSLAVLFRSLSTVLRLHRLGYETESTALDTLCTISAFTGQTTLWVLIMDSLVITFTLLMTAVFRKNVARLERLYIILIFVVPLTINWIPFINNTYGRFGAWCWIRTTNYDDCSEHQFGSILRIILWNVPFIGTNILLVPVYLFTLAYVARQRCCQKTGKDTYNPEMERLKEHLNKDVWPLLFFPLGVVFFNLFPVINGIYGSANSDPSYALWVLHAIFSPLQGGYVTLVYLLGGRDTRKRLTFRNVKSTVQSRDVVREYYIEGGGISDSAVFDISRDSHYKQYGGNKTAQLG